MFGRFFAFEMGCPEDDATPGSKPIDTVAYLNEDGSVNTAPEQGPDQGSEKTTMICECRGLGCKKCKRKKAQIITLTGNPGIPIPIMNMPMGPMSPMGLGGPSMIMLARLNLF